MTRERRCVPFIRMAERVVAGACAAFRASRIPEQPLPASYFLSSKPAWFGSLAWPPVDPANPATDDPSIIPAGYRYVHGSDAPP
jgi:hypothetical protein